VNEHAARRAQPRASARPEAGEVLIIEHDSLRKLVQLDAELSELFMRAFHPAAHGTHRGARRRCHS